METRQLQINPDIVAEAISVLSKFGWRIISNQRCNEDKREGDRLYTYTFNILIIEREKESSDTDILFHYIKFLDINDLKSSRNRGKPSKPGSKKRAFLGLILPGVFVALFTFLEIIAPRSEGGFYIFAGIAAIIGIIKFLLRFPTKKKINRYETDLKRYNEKQEELAKQIETMEAENKKRYENIVEECKVNYGTIVQLKDVIFYAKLLLLK